MINYLIIVVGATAIGKTALSIQLAQHFNTEIVSSDSRQFYKEMNIGTAVPTAEELNAATHHFIQDKSIFDTYSVGQFEKDVLQKLDGLFLKNNKFSKRNHGYLRLSLKGTAVNRTLKFPLIQLYFI